MKTKLLLLTLLAGVVYVAFEFTEYPNPLARLIGARDSAPAETASAPAADAATPAIASNAGTAPDVLVLSAPPRDGAEGGMKRFGPIADYLSAKIGRTVVYKHPATWGGYQSDMLANAYDIVFDGPHFVSWRIQQQNHNVLVKLPGTLDVVGFVSATNKRIKNISHLAGQNVCAHAPPNLGLLSVQNEFTNPARQPHFIILEGFGPIYQAVIEGKCVAGIVPKKNLNKKDPDGAQTRIVYEHKPFPEQAFTVGPRLSSEEQARIAAALMSAEAEPALLEFRAAYAFKGAFVPARNQEYARYAIYLKPVRGFYRDVVAK